MVKHAIARYRAVMDPDPSAIVVHGPDPRFRSAFNHFILDHLGLHAQDFIHIIEAGGPASLAHKDGRGGKSTDHFHMIGQIRSLVSRSNGIIKKIIIIGHEDCRYYENINYGQGKKNRPERPEKDDLPGAIWALQRIIHENIAFEAYYAKFADATRTEIDFERVHIPHQPEEKRVGLFS